MTREINRQLTKRQRAAFEKAKGKPFDLERMMKLLTTALPTGHRRPRDWGSLGPVKLLRGWMETPTDRHGLVGKAFVNSRGTRRLDRGETGLVTSLQYVL